MVLDHKTKKKIEKNTCNVKNVIYFVHLERIRKNKLLIFEQPNKLIISRLEVEDLEYYDIFAKYTFP